MSNRDLKKDLSFMGLVAMWHISGIWLYSNYISYITGSWGMGLAPPMDVMLKGFAIVALFDAFYLVSGLWILLETYNLFIRSYIDGLDLNI